MNVKKQVLWGAIVLGVTLITTAPGVGASPLAVATVGSASSSFADSSSAAHGLWSGSNQFGSLQIWNTGSGQGVSESSTSGNESVQSLASHPSTNVLHMVFTSTSGDTVELFASGNSAQVTYPDGNFSRQQLPDGGLVERVFVKPGACTSDPANMAAATGGTASVRLDARGNAIDPAEAARFSSFVKALSCEDAAVRTGLKSFASVAGLPVGSILDGRLAVPAISGNATGVRSDGTSANLGVHPYYSAGACALASALLGAATADVALEPENPLAWVALAAAMHDYQDKCGGN